MSCLAKSTTPSGLASFLATDAVKIPPASILRNRRSTDKNSGFCGVYVDLDLTTRDPLGPSKAAFILHLFCTPAGLHKTRISGHGASNLRSARGAQYD